LAKAAADFLKVAPDKDRLDVLCKHLGVTKDVYRQLVKMAFELPDNSEGRRANLASHW
jgi:hypothetical protein